VAGYEAGTLSRPEISIGRELFFMMVHFFSKVFPAPDDK
jgi:hypothetical protein